jgi:hypothetical protein
MRIGVRRLLLAALLLLPAACGNDRAPREFRVRPFKADDPFAEPAPIGSGPELFQKPGRGSGRS